VGWLQPDRVQRGHNERRAPGLASETSLTPLLFVPQTPPALKPPAESPTAPPGKAKGPAAQPAASSPRRIIDTSRLSLSIQLRLVKAVKAQRGAGSGRGGLSPTDSLAQPLTQPRPQPAPKTSFRRKKLSPEERAEKEKEEAEAARVAEAAAAKAARTSVRGLYGTRGVDHPPVLLVDGYNVLFAWLGEDDKALKVGASERVRKREAMTSIEAGRAALTARLTSYANTAQVRLIIAWDAMGRGVAGVGRADPASVFAAAWPTTGMKGRTQLPQVTPGAGVAAHPDWGFMKGVTTETAPGGLEMVWCHGTDADAFLMRAAGLLREKGAPRVLVASSDGEIQDASFRPASAISFVPSPSFLREVRWALATDAGRVTAWYAGGRARPRADAVLPRLAVKADQAGALLALRDRLASESAARRAAAEAAEGEGKGGRRGK